jgi:hypothetical protein
MALIEAGRTHFGHGRHVRSGASRLRNRVGRVPVGRTEADFQAWRDHRDCTARKYEMWARGEKLPSQMPNSMMRCPCGEEFDSHDPAGSYSHRQHIYAAQRAAR